MKNRVPCGTRGDELDRLYSQVTGAIARGQWRAVYGYENDIASMLPASDPEGGVARRGAVSAAIKAGDLEHARNLVERYSRDPEIPAQLVQQLHLLLQKDTQ